MRCLDTAGRSTRPGRIVFGAMALTGACALAIAGRASAQSAIQTPPALSARELLAPGVLAGFHFQVKELVPRRSILALPIGLTADVPATEQLSQVIAHAMPPAFLLGAVAGFVALLMGRMNGIIDRMRTINAIPDHDTARAHLKSDLPRLERRAKLVNKAIYLAVGSAISTTLLLMMAFVAAFLGRRHEPGVGALFLIALALMCGALVTLAREVRIALSEFGHHA